MQRIRAIYEHTNPNCENDGKALVHDYEVVNGFYVPCGIVCALCHCEARIVNKELVEAFLDREISRESESDGFKDIGYSPVDDEDEPPWS